MGENLFLKRIAVFCYPFFIFGINLNTMSAFIIILLILAILLVIFTLQNSFEISISVFFWEISNVPLVLLILCCVLLGYIIASVYFYPRVWKLKRDYKHALKSGKKLEEKL
ncbi:MAG TPA: DUF1049 domain-containing protein, partial [Mariniphaga anaerophila]|nr:DUF1049 domain-containing protein [Mariniphaga anaerophila]